MKSTIKKAKKISSQSRVKKTTIVAPIVVKQQAFSYQEAVEKLRNPRVITLLIIILIVVLLYLARSWFIVAIVNGQPVTRFEFMNQLEIKDGKAVLNSLITQKLILQEAAKKHITVTNQEVDAAVKQIDTTLQEQGQTLDSALALRAMTKQDFTQQVRMQKIVEKLLTNQIKVSDQEIVDYIDKNKDSLPTGISQDDLKKQVRLQLEQQKLSNKAQAFVQDLQKKAKITTFISL